AEAKNRPPISKSQPPECLSEGYFRNGSSESWLSEATPLSFEGCQSGAPLLIFSPSQSEPASLRPPPFSIRPSSSLLPPSSPATGLLNQSQPPSLRPPPVSIRASSSLRPPSSPPTAL
ncbi:unnamed protein product, partial [Linum tenue]